MAEEKTIIFVCNECKTPCEVHLKGAGTFEPPELCIYTGDKVIWKVKE